MHISEWMKHSGVIVYTPKGAVELRRDECLADYDPGWPNHTDLRAKGGCPVHGMTCGVRATYGPGLDRLDWGPGSPGRL